MKTVEELNAIGAGKLPGLLGIEILHLTEGQISGRMALRPEHLAPNGYLHAAAVIALADTLAGYGTMANLPEGGTGFTTVELKTNFIGTALNGAIRCTANLVHGGRTTQVWDAQVADEARDKVIALFRCTQLIFFSRVAGLP